ncbi:hypothetical protein [Streptomyces cinereoruber]|uniref:hypothetical protein n=1 Tax=Streptomyces cinereoruber TaxID=67260 RepID=UPI003634E178
MSLLQWIQNKVTCFTQGHDYKFDGFTLGGDWIRCRRCRKLEEYLPGLHEPKGYRPPHLPTPEPDVEQLK